MKWFDELNSTPGSITWEILKYILEQFFKDLTGDSELPSTSPAIVPAGMALGAFPGTAPPQPEVRRGGGRGGWQGQGCGAR